MTRLMTSFCALSSLATGAIAQIQLSGKVIDGNNIPVPFVEVQLKSLGLRDTTDSQGQWSILTSSNIVGIHSGSKNPFQIENQQLNFSLTHAEYVSVEMVDLQGKYTQVLSSQKMNPGQHQIPLKDVLPFGHYFVRIWVGQNCQTYQVNYSAPNVKLQIQLAQAASSKVDDLIYSLQGQILSEDQILDYRQYIEKYLQIRNVSGQFVSASRSVAKVFGIFSGGTLPAPATMRLGWLSTTQTYTGKIYTVRPLGNDVYDFDVFAYALDSLGHKSTISPSLPFDSYAGDLVLLSAQAGNAYPKLQIQANSELSIGDSLKVRYVDQDDFGGQITQRQYRFNGGDWQDLVTQSTAFVVPQVSGNYTLDTRVMDNDSNWTSNSLIIKVLEDKPQIGIQGPSPLAINANGNFNAVVQDRFGDSSRFIYEWNSGTGFQRGSKIFTGKWLSSGVHTLGLRVTDDDGWVDSSFLQVNVTNDAPQALGLIDQNVNKNDRLNFAIAVSDQDGVKKVLWDFGHGGVGNPRFDTTTRGDSSVVSHLWDSFGDYTVRMTVVDNFDKTTTQSIKIKVFDWFTDDRDGKRYKKVLVGDQVWMAENLNYLPLTNAQNGVWCYDNDSANCLQYGRLYNWATAMSFDNSCNSQSCSTQVQANHQGICPAGWHMPSDAEWAYLSVSLGSGAAQKMKTIDWGGNNSSGLTVKSSGKYYYSAFSGINAMTGMWTSTEFSGDNAWFRYLFPNDTSLLRTTDPGNGKAIGLSVRCLQNGGVTYPKPEIKIAHENFVDTNINYNYGVRLSDYGRISKYEWKIGSRNWVLGDTNFLHAWSSVNTDSIYLRVTDSMGHISDVISYRPNGFYGRLTDARDSKSYHIIQIGSQVWMAENLSFKPSNGSYFWYNNDSINYSKYGRLYNWATAMKLPNSCNSMNCHAQILTKHQGICPLGWHVPNDSEWTNLSNFLGGYNVVGLKLKTSSWGGNNLSGFTALAAGLAYGQGNYAESGTKAFFWGSTEADSANALNHYLTSWNHAISLAFTSTDILQTANNSQMAKISKAVNSSLRCIRD